MQFSTRFRRCTARASGSPALAGVLISMLALGAAAAPPKKPAKRPPGRPKILRPLGSRGGLRPPPVTPDPGSVVPSPAGAGAPTARRPAVPALPTLFQTNSPYDPRIDLKTDFMLFHGHGAPFGEIDQAIQSWRLAGYPVHRMFFIGSDAGRIYTGGQADGAPHPGDIETDAAGQPIRVGDRPYMVPTAGWLSYLKDHIRRAIDSGAEGIWPEEPLLHAAGGYSPAFQAAWQEAYKTPWQAPHSSPETFFRASRLKADLYYRAVDELLRYTKEYARQKGREVKFVLPVHSPLSMAAGNMVFPHAAASRLPLDGLVAQVWTGPARHPLTYEGKAESEFFESSWMHYSYFANLMDGVANKPLYFLADPVEDDPSYSWAQYRQWYQGVLGASLFFPQAAGYEVMPWPDRIYLPGRRMGGGTSGPAPYLTQLSNLTAALKDLPATEAGPWQGGTRGIGVLTFDTLMWQRGGPQGSSMRSLHGLALPLLKRGVPVEIVPGERATEPEFLSKFKVLLLSYDMQKPLGPEVHQGLVAWIKAGGELVLVGGEDAYNGVDEWWTRAGFPSPQEHLLKESGAAVDGGGRTVRNAADRFQEALKAEAPVRALENRRTYTLSLGPYRQAGKPLYVRFTDLHPEDGWGPWLGRVRLLEGERARADFVAGSAAERPFLVEESGSQAGKDHRFADADGSFVYRFNRLGPDARLELELGNQFRVSVASGEDPALLLQAAVPAGGAPAPGLRVGARYPVVTYPLAGAEPLYRTRGEETAPVWWSRVERGGLLFCGVPAAFGADSAAGADLVRSLVRLACEKGGLSYTEGPLVARRGPYVVGHALGRNVALKGQFLDLFDPNLPLVENPQLPYRAPAFYKEVQLQSRLPVLLHASHRATVLEASAARMRLTVSGPEGTGGQLRVFPAGMSLAGVDATDSTGRKVAVETRIEGRTLRVSYPQLAAGVSLTLRWIRPEARLTE